METDDKVKEKLLKTLHLVTVEHLINRLGLIADKYETLFERSEAFFNDMREQFIQDLIKVEIGREVEKNKKCQKHDNRYEKGVDNCGDQNKTGRITFNINSRRQGNDKETSVNQR